MPEPALLLKAPRFNSRVILRVALIGCALFWWGAPREAIAQYRFDQWTANNGLPQNSVRDILQTRDGYLWLTTFDGLVRFDGVRFTVFNKGNSPGIVTNRFLQLYEDGQSDLWASTENSGLTRLHQGRFTTYTTEDGLPGNYVNSLGSDGQGNLLIFSGFRLFQWLDDRFVPADDLRLPVGDVQSDKGQHLPGYSDRLRKLVCFVDGQLHSWDLADFLPDLNPFPPVLDSQGNTWFGSEQGLIKTRNGRLVRAYTTSGGLPGKQTRLVHGRLPLQALSINEGGALWLTDLESMQSQLVSQHPPDELKIVVSYSDREGNYWFGTLHDGLFRARKQSVTAYGKPQGLIAEEVYPILEDHDGAIWIGSAGNGLFRFKDGRFTNYKNGFGVFGALINSIDQDRAGRLWVNGAWRFEGDRFVRRISEEVLPISLDIVWTMYEDADGTRWFGTVNGVVRHKDDATTLYTTKDGLAGDDTKVIIRDTAGGIWFGSYGGLTHFRDGRFNSWTERDGLPGNTVRALYQDDDGALWIGTYDSGLGRLKDGKFTRYTTKDGLFDNGVFQILEDDRGWCWMSCNRGIYRARKQELNDFAIGKTSSISCIAYNKTDGMLNVECNGGRWPAGIKARDGKLWFPTMGGVVVIDPATVTTNAHPPPVVIEGVRIDNAAVAVDSRRSAVRIEPTQHNFEIDYTALSFINSENLRFKYKLEGLDQDWVEAGARRTAYFSHVPPGEYTFKVIAANSDGVWNEDGNTLRIRVIPPVYRRWWFVTLAGLAVAGIIWFGYQNRVNRLKQAEADQAAFSQQLLNSQEQERKRIAVGLHDSLGQDLLVIKNRAMIELNSAREDNPSREGLNEISNTASQAIEEVRQIIYDLRPYQLDKIGLASTLRFMVEKVAASSTIEFQVAFGDIDDRLPYDSEITLYRIVQECVNNIIKHSQATSASVRIERTGNVFNLTIEDNGCGFTPEAASVSDPSRGGLGLTGISERVRMLGGTYAIKSSPGRGTRVLISINV